MAIPQWGQSAMRSGASLAGMGIGAAFGPGGMMVGSGLGGIAGMIPGMFQEQPDYAAQAYQQGMAQLQQQQRAYQSLMMRGADPNVREKGMQAAQTATNRESSRVMGEIGGQLRGAGYGPGQQAALEQKGLGQTFERSQQRERNVEASFAQQDAQTRSQNQRAATMGMAQIGQQGAQMQMQQAQMQMQQQAMQQQQADAIAGAVGQMVGGLAQASTMLGDDMWSWGNDGKTTSGAPKPLADKGGEFDESQPVGAFPQAQSFLGGNAGMNPLFASGQLGPMQFGAPPGLSDAMNWMQMRRGMMPEGMFDPMAMLQQSAYGQLALGVI